MLARIATVSLFAFVVACSSSTTDSGGGPATAGGGNTGSAGHGGSSATTAGAGGSVSSAGTTSGIAGSGASSVAGAGGTSSAAGSGGALTSGGAGGAAGSAGAGQAGAGGMTSTGPAPKQSLIWVWLDYKNSINTVIKNKASFTHVSPALYQLNYSYSSGAPKLVNTNDSFDGLSSKQIADMVHAAGLKVQPLMYAGAGNSGTDQGIQNILNNATTQQNFIDATVAECVAKGYDGINLDWEVQGTNFQQYGTKLISFLTAFTAAMHAKNMVVTFDLGGWYTRQCGDDTGLVDLTLVGHSVDQMIMEDYSGTFGGPATACPAKPGNAACDQSYVKELDVMCNLPKDVVNIGLISPEGGNGGTNPFAVDALDAVDSYGFRAVSLWPDDGNFINSNNVQDGGTWYSVLAAWLAKP